MGSDLLAFAASLGLKTVDMFDEAKTAGAAGLDEGCLAQSSLGAKDKPLVLLSLNAVGSLSELSLDAPTHSSMGKGSFSINTGHFMNCSI
ncbi:hypothetical protein AB1Y20_018916 [Prymnesium parvum]|uniref:Uncharacterized protein n=1 Tax=Prymnesium parvum TaxID=97485 RepID=A0AB34JQ28_PRYPA